MARNGRYSQSVPGLATGGFCPRYKRVKSERGCLMHRKITMVVDALHDWMFWRTCPLLVARARDENRVQQYCRERGQATGGKHPQGLLSVWYVGGCSVLLGFSRWLSSRIEASNAGVKRHKLVSRVVSQRVSKADVTHERQLRRSPLDSLRMHVDKYHPHRRLSRRLCGAWVERRMDYVCARV